MKRTFSIVAGTLLLAVAGMVCSNCRAIKRNTDSKPVTHELWDALLKKHVGPDGFVRYAAFKQDTNALNQYLKVLESAHPSDKNWSRNEQMAYWINAYNAYTVQLVLRNYPVESIKDIKRGGGLCQLGLGFKIYSYSRVYVRFEQHRTQYPAAGVQRCTDSCGHQLRVLLLP